MTPPIIRRYVALGDSLSEGFSDWSQADRSIGFAYLLAGQLRAKSPELDFVNLGSGGARTADVLRSQLPRAITAAPDFVTLVVGANDVPGTPIEQFRRDYSELVRRLRTGIACLIAIANLPDFAHLLPAPYATYRTMLHERVHTFNRIIADAAAAHGALLVDLHSSREVEDPRNVSRDGFHPSARGYRAMAHVFVETLNTAGFDLTLPPLDERPTTNDERPTTDTLHNR